MCADRRVVCSAAEFSCSSGLQCLAADQVCLIIIIIIIIVIIIIIIIIGTQAALREQLEHWNQSQYSRSLKYFLLMLLLLLLLFSLTRHVTAAVTAEMAVMRRSVTWRQIQVSSDFWLVDEDHVT